MSAIVYFFIGYSVAYGIGFMTGAETLTQNRWKIARARRVAAARSVRHLGRHLRCQGVGWGGPASILARK